MIREEMLQHMKNMSYFFSAEALEMATDELIKQEPCEDCISRQAVLMPYEGLKDDDVISVWLVKKNIEQQKTVTPQEPKTGRWTRELIRNEYGGCIGGKMICSECGQDNGYDKRMKYCPNCGARMSEDKVSQG